MEVIRYVDISYLNIMNKIEEVVSLVVLMFATGLHSRGFFSNG